MPTAGGPAAGFFAAQGFLAARGFFAAQGLAVFVAHGFFAAHGFFTCADASVALAHVSTPATAIELTTYRTVRIHLLLEDACHAE